MGRGKRSRRRDRPPPSTSSYSDADGNSIELRDSLSPGTIRQIRAASTGPAGSVDDTWQRREELLFEYLAVSWTVAGLPLDDQKLLLGRYRMATSEERRWVRARIDEHLHRHLPELT